MSNQLQGDIAEILAMSYFIKQGHLCSMPISHSSYYDFIVDIDGVLYKVETKSSSFKKPSGNYEFSLVTKGGNKSGSFEHKRIDQSKVDLIFLYSSDGFAYLYPSSFLHR